MSKHNASPSAFGWQFQVNAAIFFLLDYIDDIKYVRVEGPNEDIELHLLNDKKVFIQAKSYSSMGIDVNAQSKLSEGLETLLKASNIEDYEKLYFVTNYPNPLGGRQSQYHIFMSNGYVEMEFLELPQTVIDTTDKKIQELEKVSKKIFNREKFNIAVLPFIGNVKKSRERIIKDAVKEYLNKLGVSDSKATDLLLIWQSEMFFNSSQINTRINLSKRQLVWPIIVLNCEISNDDKYIDDLVDMFELEEEDIEIVANQYKQFIDKQSEQFSFVNKVINDYTEYRKKNRQMRKVHHFINMFWKEYTDEIFCEDMEDEMLETLVKMILNKVLRKKRLIGKILSEVSVDEIQTIIH